MKSLQTFINLIPHWVLLVLAGATGALLTYFQQTSTTSLVAAVTSWTLLKPILAGSVTVFLTATITLLKAAPWSNASAPRVPPLPILAFLLLTVSACAALATAVPGIIDIVDAECTQAEQQPATPGWVDFLCTVLTPKPGEAAKFTYRVKAEDAQQFAALHAPKGGH